METSLREGFNIGYDVMIISDATASGNRRHYETTLERVRDYYGLVMDIARFKKAIATLDKIRTGEIKIAEMSEEVINGFLEEFNLLDPRTFGLKTGVQSLVETIDSISSGPDEGRLVQSLSFAFWSYSFLLIRRRFGLLSRERILSNAAPKRSIHSPYFINS